jgi:hypothetical protein
MRIGSEVLLGGNGMDHPAMPHVDDRLIAEANKPTILHVFETV